MFFVLLCALILFAVGGLFWLNCTRVRPLSIYDSECVVDTVMIVDTVRYYAPMAVSTRPMGYKYVKVPVKGKMLQSDTDTQKGIEIAESNESNERYENNEVGDSVDVELPVIQNVYESSDYKAYVSGVYAQLDSIFVFPKREIITIKKPPKHWHIGPCIGYGYTRQGGFQSYIGISLTYSILSF